VMGAGAATAGKAELVSLAARLWITLAEGVAFVVAMFLWGGRSALGTMREEMERAKRDEGQPQSTASAER